ncbi:asparagine synthase, partial [Candidatus Omnitrophus magneticus]
PNTIFKDIFNLSKGHMLIYQNANVKIKQYWDIDTGKMIAMDEDIIKGRVWEMFDETVKLHMYSDVWLRIFVSCGVYSSTILEWMS